MYWFVCMHMLFFFKQKTAYDVRISDWSSDVCSSDLLCFPELDAGARTALVKANLRDIGLMLVEFALGWLGSDRRIAAIPTRIEGLQHLEAERKSAVSGKSVSVRVEFGGRRMSKKKKKIEQQRDNKVEKVSTDT